MQRTKQNHILLPPNVTRMIDEVEIPRQIRKGVQQICQKRDAINKPIKQRKLQNFNYKVAEGAKPTHHLELRVGNQKR